MATKKEITFEQAITELQDVVEKLEAGKVALEESLSLYERGVELVKICNARLDLAEQRISVVRLEGGKPHAQRVDGEVLE